jgi:hypothetical protein
MLIATKNRNEGALRGQRDSHAAPNARTCPGYDAVRAGQSQVHRFFLIFRTMRPSEQYDSGAIRKTIARREP